MKRKLFLCLLVAGITLGCSEYALGGVGKGGGKNSVDVCNTNAFDDENGDIRVWLLTESEADPPPATKAEADALCSIVVAGQSMATFANLDAGNYVLVAANENHYSGLDDDAAITIGTDFSVQAFTLEQGTLEYSVVNSDSETSVPVITEGCGDDEGDGDGDGGDGGDGGEPPTDGGDGA